MSSTKATLNLELDVIDGIEALAQRGQYSTERFLFNSA